MNDTATRHLPWTRYALALGGGLVLYGLAFRLLGLDSSSPLTWIFYLAQPVVLVWLTRAESARPSLSRGRRFGASMLAAVAGNAIYATYVYLYNRFVDDSLLRDGLAAQLAKLQASDLSPADIAAQSALWERSFTPLLFSVNVLVGLTLVALLCALALLAWPTARAAELPGERAGDPRRSD